MATEKTTQILDQIKTLTILELADLVKALEEEFGVSAAAPVAVAAAPAAAPAEAVEEKTEFNVVLKDFGANKIAVREITGLGLVEAKAVVEKLGTIKEAVSKEEATKMVEKFKEAGATAVAE